MSETVTGETVTGDAVTCKAVMKDAVMGRAVTDETVTDEAVTVTVTREGGVRGYASRSSFLDSSNCHWPSMSPCIGWNWIL
jgi:hypothetical protein